MARQKTIIHKRTSVLNRVPSAEILTEGEIAVNYAKGSEKLYIKNGNGEVVGFPSDVIVGGKQDKLIGTAIEGQNIKTINGQEILGSGDIVIPKGDKGDKGDTGEAFNIFKTFASIEEMELDLSVPENKFVLISNDNVEDVHNAKLYVRTASGYNYLTDMSGATGIQGVPGNDGKDGQNGKSAYELAVDGGYKGTQEEWLASLKGEKGEQGQKGETGTQGPAGSKGDKGEQGAAGEQGPIGPDGKSAYQIAVEGGYKGTQEQWLGSLKGEPGTDGHSPVVTIGSNGNWFIDDVDTNSPSRDFSDIDPNVKIELPYKYKNGDELLPVYRKNIEFELNDVADAEIIIDDAIPEGKTLRVLNNYLMRYEFEAGLNPLELDADYVSYSNLNLIENTIMLSDYTLSDGSSKKFRKGSIMLSSKQGNMIGKAYTTIDYALIDIPSPELKLIRMSSDVTKVSSKGCLSHYKENPVEVGSWYSDTTGGVKTKVKDERYVAGNKLFTKDMFVPEQGKEYFVGIYADEVYSEPIRINVPAITFGEITETHSAENITISGKVNNIYVDSAHPGEFAVWHKNEDGLTYNDIKECKFDKETGILSGTIPNPNTGSAEKEFSFGIMANGVRSPEKVVLMPAKTI